MSVADTILCVQDYRKKMIVFTKSNFDMCSSHLPQEDSIVHNYQSSDNKKKFWSVIFKDNNLEYWLHLILQLYSE